MVTLVDTCESVHQYQDTEQGRHTYTYIAIGQSTQKGAAAQSLLQCVGSKLYVCNIRTKIILICMTKV